MNHSLNSHYILPEHLIILDQQWLRKGGQDFLHSQAYPFSLIQQGCLPWRLPYQTCQVQGLRDSHPQQCPADPGQVFEGGTAVCGTLLTKEPLAHPELLQWNVVIYLFSEGIFLPKILYFWLTFSP